MKNSENKKSLDKKVIFFDIDGTLTPNHVDVSDLVRYAIRRARENGHYTMLCSGRNRIGVEEMLKIGFDGAICSVGGLIELHGERIYESGAKTEAVQLAMQVLGQLGAPYSMETNDSAYQTADFIRNRILHRPKYLVMTEEMIREIIAFQESKFHFCDLDQYDGKETIQTICYYANGKEQLAQIREQLEKYFRILVYDINEQGVIDGEMIPLEHDKGKAVQYVMNHLGIPIENSIGFGDSMNDLEMITACHTGVVMGNGSEELKQYASRVCESVEEDGVYHEMVRMGLV